MINEEKWLGTLTIIKSDLKNDKKEEQYFKSNKSNFEKKTYGSIKKYSLITILFVSGLLLVSAIKNETRNLQREINILQASINEIKFNLDQALLDNEVMTSPENISKLANEYLEDDLKTYKKSQIQKLNNEVEEKLINKKSEERMTKVPKIGTSYSGYKFGTIAVKKKIQKKIETTKKEINNIYDSPKSIIHSEKAKRWAAVQVIKAFLGVPVIPGR